VFFYFGLWFEVRGAGFCIYGCVVLRLGLGSGNWNLGFEVWDLGVGMYRRICALLPLVRSSGGTCSKFKGWVLGFRVSGSGFRAWDFREVSGSGFRAFGN